MKLIADAGSTGTQWVVMSEGVVVKQFASGPINPSVMDEGSVRSEITSAFTENLCGVPLESIEYYGSGCRPGHPTEIVRDALQKLAPEARVEVASDMLGACRAALGSEPGIVCILGTGSNACRYDGKRIVDSIPSLGYILGDEGGGADIGRRLVNAACKRLLPKSVAESFFRFAGMEVDGFIEHVYRQPGANSFLASLAPFAINNRDVPELKEIVYRAIADFYVRNIVPLEPRSGERISCVGSIGWLLGDEFRAEAERLGLIVENIMRSPLEGLTR